MFENRAHAAKLLTEQLKTELGEAPISLEPHYVVGSCSDGSLIIAREIAEDAKVPLIFMATESIPPIEGQSHGGEASSHGVIAWEKQAAQNVAGEHSHLGSLAREAVKRAFDTEQRWRQKLADHCWPKLKDRQVILVQENVLSTAKPHAVLWSLRNAGVKRVVLATPIILKHIKEGLQREFDLIVSLLVPEELFEIENVYENEQEVDEQDLLAAMKTVALGVRSSSLQIGS